MKAFKITLLGAALGAAGFICTSCSLEDEENLELIDTSRHFEEIVYAPGSLEQQFVDDANLCTQGDLSVLDSLTERYLSTSRPESEHYLLYQQYGVNRSFEKCAQKVMQTDRTFLSKLINDPVIAALIARDFYLQGSLTDGAYWLQRVINSQGQAQGYTTAGRIFLMKSQTMKTGALLLQTGARLGSKEAEEILMGSINPNSQYYQNVTQMLTREYREKLQSEGKELVIPKSADAPTLEDSSDNP